MQSSNKQKRSLPHLPGKSSSQYKERSYSRDTHEDISRQKNVREEDHRSRNYSKSLDRPDLSPSRDKYYQSTYHSEDRDYDRRPYHDSYSPRLLRKESLHRNPRIGSYHSLNRDDYYNRYEQHRDHSSYRNKSPRRQYSSSYQDSPPVEDAMNSWQRSSLPARTKTNALTSPTHSWQRSSLPAHSRGRLSPTRPPLVTSKSESYGSYGHSKKKSDFKSLLGYDKNQKYKQMADPNAPFEMHFKHKRNSSYDVDNRSEARMKRSSSNYKDFEHSSSFDNQHARDAQQQSDVDESYKILKEGLQIRKSKQVYKFERSASEGHKPNAIYDDPLPPRRVHSSRNRVDYPIDEYERYGGRSHPYDDPYDSYRTRNEFDRSSHYSSRSNPLDNASSRYYDRDYGRYDSYRRSPPPFDHMADTYHTPYHTTQTATQTEESSMNFHNQFGYLHDPSHYNRYPGIHKSSFFNFIKNWTWRKKKTTDPKYIYMNSPAPQHYTQVLATLAVALGPLCTGLGKGYSSPALASMDTLSAQGKHFPISKEQGSWVASLSLLGAFFGSLPAGMSIRYGRKLVLCVVAIPFALSWILTVVATNIHMLYAASLLGGVCTAIIAVVTPVYISEIAHPDIRGCLCALSKLSSNIGMLLSYLLGAFLNWRQLAGVTAFAPALLFIAALLIPETPSYLLYRGRDTEAAASLAWLRSGRDVARELTTMKANIATLRRQELHQPPSVAFRDLIRPLFVTCGLMVFQKFSGANAFNFYAVPILSETFVGLDPYRAAVVVAFVQICAGMASSALVDTVGRRPLLVFSNMLMSVALAAFGGYVYYKGLDTNEDMFARQQWKESDWVPLFCILVIEIAFALGVSPISWLYIGELFPLKHRGFGALAASVSYACSFASVKSFVDLQLTLGLYGAFWLYSSLAALALVFTLVFVPETKGLSLQEMQEQHNKHVFV